MAADMALLAKKYGIDDLSNIFEVERGLSVLKRMISDGGESIDVAEVSLLKYGLEDVRLGLIGGRLAFSSSKADLRDFIKMAETVAKASESSEGEGVLSAAFFEQQRILREFIKNSLADGTLQIHQEETLDNGRETYYTGTAANTASNVFARLINAMQNSGINLPIVYCSSDGDTNRIGVETFHGQPLQPVTTSSNSSFSIPVIDGFEEEVDPINFNQEAMDRYLASLKRATANPSFNGFNDVSKVRTFYFGKERNHAFEDATRKTIKQVALGGELLPSSRLSSSHVSNVIRDRSQTQEGNTGRG